MRLFLSVALSGCVKVSKGHEKDFFFFATNPFLGEKTTEPAISPRWVDRLREVLEPTAAAEKLQQNQPHGGFSVSIPSP